MAFVIIGPTGFAKCAGSSLNVRGTHSSCRLALRRVHCFSASPRCRSSVTCRPRSRWQRPPILITAAARWLTVNGGGSISRRLFPHQFWRRLRWSPCDATRGSWHWRIELDCSNIGAAFACQTSVRQRQSQFASSCVLALDRNEPGLVLVRPIPHFRFPPITDTSKVPQSPTRSTRGGLILKWRRAARRTSSTWRLASSVAPPRSVDGRSSSLGW